MSPYTTEMAYALVHLANIYRYLYEYHIMNERFSVCGVVSRAHTQNHHALWNRVQICVYIYIYMDGKEYKKRG